MDNLFNLSLNNPLRPIRELGKDKIKVFCLGIGTTWFGRPWPPQNPFYTYPDSKEISNYFDKVFSKMNDKETKVMIDTSPAYGLSEQKIGDYFENNQELALKSFIATKWGEEFDMSIGISTINHSKDNLIASVKRSLSCLKKIDLLYIHRTSNEVLKNDEVVEEMRKMKNQGYGNIHYIGASFSNEDALHAAIKANLINYMDVIQIPAAVFLKRPDLVRVILQKDIGIVLNSPVRKSAKKPPGEIFAELTRYEETSVILTGTRNHLEETIGYFFKTK